MNAPAGEARTEPTIAAAMIFVMGSAPRKLAPQHRAFDAYAGCEKLL